jgi:hypothetical protein
MKYFGLLFIILFFAFRLNAQSNSLVVEDVGFTVKGEICIDGSLNDKTGDVDVDGDIYFKNNSQCDVILNANSNYAKANFHLNGVDDIYMYANSVEIRSLYMNQVGADLFLADELEVKSQITMLRGLIRGAENAEVSLLNPAESAIIFNDVRTNDSYFCTKLTRLLLPNVKYVFPLGDSDSYHPVMISEVDKTASISVLYSNDLDEQWRDEMKNVSAEFPFSGAWVIDDDGFESKFKLYLSCLDDKKEVLDLSVAQIKSKQPFVFQEQPEITYSLYGYKDFYKSTNEISMLGVYSLIKKELGLNKAEDDIVLVNVLVGDSGNKTKFKVTELEKFVSVNLKVYDSWGRMVYLNDNYDDSFDAMDFPEGTYYYHLVGETKEGKMIRKNDILEIIKVK